MMLSDYIQQDCPDTVRSTGAYIVFYQVVPIDHCTNVPGLFAQSSAESEYNSEFTAVMVLANFIMLNNDIMNKDPYVVPYQAPIVIIDKISSVCMANNGKNTKHTRHICIRMHFVVKVE